MTNTNETAEPSGASAGSQPVAWMVEWTDHIDLFRSRSCAEYVASGDVKVQPLYRSPALTDEEREAIEGAMWDYGQYADEMGLSATEAMEKQAALRLLLERTK